LERCPETGAQKYVRQYVKRDVKKRPGPSEETYKRDQKNERPAKEKNIDYKKSTEEQHALLSLRYWAVALTRRSVEKL